MIATDARTDEAIAAALARICTRAEPLGGGFARLADAIGRAASGGKRLRPALVTASFAAFGGRTHDTPAVFPVAAAFELLHTAFVVHDDVIDHDTLRRGVPNVSGEFRLLAGARGADAEGQEALGDAAAILAGDLLLHEASRLIATADVDAVTRERLFALYDDAVYVSAAGELADVEHTVSDDCPDTSSILDATFNKTAVYSFRAPLQAGAVLAGAPSSALDAVGVAGGCLGLAFQLVDDLIGTFGTTAQTGRDVGVDLREAKRTPVVALARGTSQWARVSDAIAVAHTGPVAIREAQRALEASGARARVAALVDGTRADAAQAAAALPDEASALIDSLSAGIRERIP